MKAEKELIEKIDLLTGMQLIEASLRECVVMASALGYGKTYGVSLSVIADGVEAHCKKFKEHTNEAVSTLLSGDNAEDVVQK